MAEAYTSQPPTSPQFQDGDGKNPAFQPFPAPQYAAQVNAYPPTGVGYNNQAFVHGQPGQPAPTMYPPPPYPPQQTGAVGYYPNQPGAPLVYAGQPPYGGQTTTVVLAPAPPVVVQQTPYASYCGMIVFACIVAWLFNALFGLIAFILAVVAENSKATDPNGARKLGKASMWVSISGIIVTVIIIAIVVGVVVGTGSYYGSYYNRYYYYG